MRRDDEDPFDDFFDEIERMMRGMVDDGPGGIPSDAHVSVYEADGRLRLVADLPGVAEEELGLKCDGETFTIRAGGAGREFEESVTLPVRVDEHSADASFNNGVLEVDFDVVEDSTSIDLD